MSGSDDNELHISTNELDVTLRGAEGAVAEAYRALRSVLVDSVSHETVDRTNRDGDSDGKSDSESKEADGSTQPMHRATPQPDGDEGPTSEMSAAVRAVSPEVDPPDAGAFIQLILRRRRYIKVHLLERRDVAESFLGRSLDPTHLSRIYTDAETEDRLRDRVDFGDTVWRRLTPEGRAEVEAEIPEADDRRSEENDSL